MPYLYPTFLQTLSLHLYPLGYALPLPLPCRALKMIIKFGKEKSLFVGFQLVSEIIEIRRNALVAFVRYTVRHVSTLFP